ACHTSALGCIFTPQTPFNTASTISPVMTADRKILSIRKVRSCIWLTIAPGSKTRDFSSAMPNTAPMATPRTMADRTFMGLSFVSGSNALHQERGGDGACKHGGDGDGGADRKLRHAGDAVARGAAIGDACAQHHDETAGEGHGCAARQLVDADGPLPDRRDSLPARA